jgi:hypothetical protein
MTKFKYLMADVIILNMRLTAGIYAAKALVQLLCGRLHAPDNLHVFMPGV